MMFERKVLDHGRVELLNIAGPVRRPYEKFDANDIDPALVARTSFARGMEFGRESATEMKLVNYLFKNKHSTPIEMIETWWSMDLPIFVARQLIRHRTATVNEVSGRYVVLPEKWYIPDVVGGKPVGGAKQGRSDSLGESTQTWFKSYLNAACERDYHVYKRAVNEEGVAAEHARLLLHLNHYTSWIFKIDFSNMLNLLRLRDHSHAQGESVEYAQAIDSLLREHVPGLMQCYDEHIRMEPAGS